MRSWPGSIKSDATAQTFKHVRIFGPMALIGSAFASDLLQYNTQFDQALNQLRKLESLEKEIRLGGGKKNIEKQHEKGKLTARERIEKLIDKGSDFLEIGLHTAYGFYESK